MCKPRDANWRNCATLSLVTPRRAFAAQAYPEWNTDLPLANGKTDMIKNERGIPHHRHSAAATQLVPLLEVHYRGVALPAGVIGQRHLQVCRPSKHNVGRPGSSGELIRYVAFVLTGSVEEGTADNHTRSILFRVRLK